MRRVYFLFSCFILTALFLNGGEQKPTTDLNHYELKIYSQNGEDGIILRLFDLVGTTNKYFVEFGVENGFECNTRFLREYLGWQGLMMDGRFSTPSLNLQQEFITAENINDLFAKHHVPEEFDLLSIDLDYNDFYIWLNLSPSYRPRVVVIEYNATHSWNEDKVVLYDPFTMWDFTNYSGASIKALYNLGIFKGYTLVYAEKVGVNLFFIRDDVYKALSQQILHAGVVEKIYRKPRYGHGPNGGHTQDPLNRPYISSEDIIRNFEISSN